jgi:hypothetical protein
LKFEGISAKGLRTAAEVFEQLFARADTLGDR